ncbi:hypothetical protein CALCODRAFT_487132 [Calocera cornea HHB12733]|uniref:DUF6532 domain-containing protein n=1 Tax=Calocera cornea HHB12733 TaxID=1353952 RepID=A0A165DB57_9BASI|nr:hypothetical protein CALCODRAFT_487132 [Calocera cornea HHB12733]
MTVSSIQPNPPRTSSGPRGWFARKTAAATTPAGTTPAATTPAAPTPAAPTPAATTATATIATATTSTATTVSPPLLSKPAPPKKPSKRVPVNAHDDFVPEDNEEGDDDDSQVQYQGSSTRTRRLKTYSKKRAPKEDSRVKTEKATKRARTSTSVEVQNALEVDPQNHILSIHNPPVPTLPKSGSLKLKDFCEELRDTIQEAKILYRLQFATIDLYAADNVKADFMTTAVLLANRSAHARWEKRIERGDLRAINGTLQGTNLTLAQPLIAHYGPWFRTIIKTVAQNVVKQCYPELFALNMTPIQRQHEVARLLDENTYIYADVFIHPSSGKVKRRLPFQHPAIREVIVRAWFASGKEGDGFVFPELFLPSREPDGVIAAAAVSLLFALKQYETGRFEPSEFSTSVYRPSYASLAWNLDWLKRKYTEEYKELLAHLLAVAVKTHQEQEAQQAAAISERREEDEGHLLFLHMSDDEDNEDDST